MSFGTLFSDTICWMFWMFFSSNSPFQFLRSVQQWFWLFFCFFFLSFLVLRFGWWLSVYKLVLWSKNYCQIPLITTKNFASLKGKKKKQCWCHTYCTNVKLWSVSHIFSVEMVEAWSHKSWPASMHMPCRMDIMVPFQVQQIFFFFF